MIGSLPRYLALVKIAQKRSEFREFAQMLTVPQLHTFLGMLNHLLPIAYKRAFKFRGKKRTLDDRKLQEMALAKETHKAPVATTGMEKYLKAHCPQAHYSRPTLIKYRRFLEVLGIFRVKERQFGGARFPTQYEDINLTDALLLCEALEEVLIGQSYNKGTAGKGCLDVLPKHKYFSLVRLFNSIFRDFNLAWRRVWEEEPIFGAWAFG